MRRARVASLQSELAATSVSDAELALQLGIDEARVGALSRGRVRSFAPDGEGPADLAGRAAVRALERAGLAVEQIDFILFATNTPDMTFPGSACLLQASLDAGTTASMDVRSQCTGFLVALDLARRFVASGTYEHVLVAAGEVPSHQTRFDGVDPELTCLTSDAAAVAIVAPALEADGTEILACAIRTDGSLHRQFWCQYPASRNLGRHGVARGERLVKWMLDDGGVFPQIDFKAARATARLRVPEILDEALTEAGLRRVDVGILAHVDPETEDEIRAMLGERVGWFCEHDGLYSYSATLPVALADLVASGEIRPRQTVALLTAGAGASWGAAILRMGP